MLNDVIDIAKIIGIGLATAILSSLEDIIEVLRLALLVASFTYTIIKIVKIMTKRDD